MFKKGRKSSAENYRPTSLTSHICKLMKRLLREGIIQHLSMNNRVKSTQHGFVKNRSCLTNLLTFLEMVTTYSEKGLPVDVAYMNFAKAFDKVPHERQGKKLQVHGIYDDTKIYGRVGNNNDIGVLAYELHKRSKDWQMPLNIDKFKTWDVRHNNPRHNYQINNISLQYDEEKDLGVKIHHSLKVVQQAWKPRLQNNIAALKKVQHQATKIIPELSQPTLVSGTVEGPQG
ncbi:uncharacterized protein [Procambarus clarkii]|uniref:uncharacterized protein n=1 Tax=Procambarus clarkii TaxID=6728 RepID=UPI0037445A45